MARLILPIFAYAWYGKHIDNSGKIVRNAQTGKYHLSKVVRTNYVHTVCGHFVDPILDQNVITRPIESLKPEDFCEKCLGAMKAVED